MKAINLSMRPVQLAPVNGPGMLAPATEDSDGLHERDLDEVTDRERGLAAAGIILLEDAAGRARPKPKLPTPTPDAGGEPA